MYYAGSVSKPLILTAVAVSLLVSTAAAAQDVCFAYLRNGDVYFSCGDKDVRLTATGTVSDFAIANDGRFVALQEQHFIPQSNEIDELDCDVRLFAASSGTVLRTVRHACGQLYATCGTLLVEDHGEVRNLSPGHSAPSFPGYKRFVCSSDQSAVGGWPGDDNQNFATGKTKITPMAPVAGDAAISNSGNAAYWTESSNSNSVCVFDAGSKPVCLENADAFDGVSVSDSSEVLFTTHTHGGCWYRGSRVARDPAGVGDDQCLGIAKWKPGSEKIIVKDLADRPQWLTAPALAALKKCSNISPACFKLRRPAR